MHQAQDSERLPKCIKPAMSCLRESDGGDGTVVGISRARASWLGTEIAKLASDSGNRGRILRLRTEKHGRDDARVEIQCQRRSDHELRGQSPCVAHRRHGKVDEHTLHDEFHLRASAEGSVIAERV